MENREILERLTELDGFRSEIQLWIGTELQKKKEWEERGETGEAYDPHADFLRPEFLNETDMIIWGKIKDETVTKDDMMEYSQKFEEETAQDPPDVFESRENFKAMIISKSIPIIIASKGNINKK